MVGPPTGDAPLLALEGVTKRFAGVAALDQVSFALRRGEVHALLGENGAGKSTLIKVLGGIHLPEAGTIRIDGRIAPIRTDWQKTDRGLAVRADGPAELEPVAQPLEEAPIAEALYNARRLM
jgi:ABC-type sugar transport system ATPase subunit